MVAAGPEATVVCGDMNIAPTDDDVFDPDAYVGQTHVTPPERAALAELQALGLHDVVRDRWPDERVFSYWDYRAGMFHQDLGMRIDLILASAPVADRVQAAWVDRQARKGSGPSDHAPVIVDLDEAPDGDIGPVVPPPSSSGDQARREEAAAVAVAQVHANSPLPARRAMASQVAGSTRPRWARACSGGASRSVGRGAAGLCRAPTGACPRESMASHRATRATGVRSGTIVGGAMYSLGTCPSAQARARCNRGPHPFVAEFRHEVDAPESALRTLRRRGTRTRLA